MQPSTSAGVVVLDPLDDPDPAPEDPEAEPDALPEALPLALPEPVPVVPPVVPDAPLALVLPEPDPAEVLPLDPDPEDSPLVAPLPALTWPPLPLPFPPPPEPEVDEQAQTIPRQLQNAVLVQFMKFLPSFAELDSSHRARCVEHMLPSSGPSCDINAGQFLRQRGPGRGRLDPRGKGTP